MLNVECYPAPHLFGLPFQHMRIDEDYKNVSIFAIKSQSEDESMCDQSVLHMQMDVCSYFLYLSCQFYTFIDTQMIVLPKWLCWLQRS